MRTSIDKRRTTPIWQRDFSSTLWRRDDRTEERLRRIQEENAARVRKEEEARQIAESRAKRLRDEQETERRKLEAETRSQSQQDTEPTTHVTEPQLPLPVSAAAAVPATAAETSKRLPSHAESKRSDLQKRALKLLDDLLVKANTISQQVNQYTGTDYTGIEALRQEISKQEQTVRQRSQDLTSARTTLNEAYAAQATAQREIVGLLERKSSWSPSDLERYMSLVRSEHLNEQSVTQAKEGLETAEQRLEEGRALLERLERKQYHEEQVWNNMIRRNSTWLTFGLMGFNIILLLANIVVFEPWRRDKIIRGMEGLLEKKHIVHFQTEDRATQTGEAELDNQASENDVLLNTNVSPASIGASSEKAATTAADFMRPGEVLPAETPDLVGTVPSVAEEMAQSKPEAVYDSKRDTNGVDRPTFETWQDTLSDLFSDRVVQMRKVDITNIALQGAASGFAIMGLLFVLLRPT